jgi:hypothetical protein
MCDTLSELRQSLSRYAASFDAALLSAAQAASALESATAIERMAALIKAKVAARRGETRAWKGTGQRSAAHDLARSTGSSVGQAAEALATARRLESLPTLDAAARCGALSGAQTAAIADAASADPSAEARLVAKGRESSLAELRQECARTKAAACADLEARRQKVHEGRFCRDWTDADGAWHLHMRHSPEVGAQFMAALAPIRDRVFATARQQGRREPLAAYAADALVEVVCATAATGAQPEQAPARRATAKVIVRIDLASLLRGYPVEGETTEIAGFGPVAVSAIRDLIDTGDPFLAAVITAGQAVVEWRIWDGAPGPAPRQRSNGSTPPVPPKDAPPAHGSRTTIASTGPRPTSPCSTCSTDCAATTTTSRPARAGPSSTAAANGPSWRPRTLDILDIRPGSTTHQVRRESRASPAISSDPVDHRPGSGAVRRTTRSVPAPGNGWAALGAVPSGVGPGRPGGEDLQASAG